ncbi:MAG: DUF2911 domain-containing protein [Flavobacteriales bacterium]|nr:DUF2911 domain-containing protein [Flavobacteriales bacterium]
MKNGILTCLVLVSLVAGSFSVNAKGRARPSQWAEVHQRIGLTDMNVTYSRPNVKDRTIWGELVAYDKIWRAGANEATKFTTNDNIKIKGKDLKAGSYAVFITPTKDSWKIHFNSDYDVWGTGDYDAAKDVLVVDVAASEGSKVESMRFTFDNLTATTCDLTFAWAEIRCSVSIKADIEAKLFANLETKIKNTEADGLAYCYLECALQCAEQKLRIDQGVEWINKSIELDPAYWYTYWVKADVLWEKGDKAGSIENLKIALEKGIAKKGKDFSYKDKLNYLVTQRSK